MDFDKSQGRYKDFSVLIALTRKKIKHFGDNIVVSRFLSKTERMTRITNPIVHKLEYDGSKGDIEEIKVSEILALLEKIDTGNVLKFS